MHRTFTCTRCPKSCEIEIEAAGLQIISVKGHDCDKGEEYAEQEITNPQRLISSLVKIKGGKMPLASVRLDKPIPKQRIFDVMKEIRTISLDAPVYIGQIAIKNVLGLNSNLIVTCNVELEK